MRTTILRALTWGTVAAALIGALLLATADLPVTDAESVGAEAPASPQRAPVKPSNGAAKR